MATVRLKLENSSREITLSTSNGVATVSAAHLGGTFELDEASVRVFQLLIPDDEDITTEIKSVDAAGYRTFILHAQFGVMFKVIGTLMAEDTIQRDHGTTETEKILRSLNRTSELGKVLSTITTIQEVETLPVVYDGNILFRLPPKENNHQTKGIEQKYDGHVWTEEVTSNIVGFPGRIRIRKCAGYIQCNNMECSFYKRSLEKNEKVWHGRISSVCRPGISVTDFGSLRCLYCSIPPLCVQTCPCKLFLCLPHNTSLHRCVIHVGNHIHPVNSGTCQRSISELKEKVSSYVQVDHQIKPKKLQKALAKEVIMDYVISETTTPMGDLELEALLDKISPSIDTRRLARWKAISRNKDVGIGEGLDALLQLKRKCKYDYFHSMVFPGQLQFSSFNRCHVFKMSTIGMGSGVDLVNKMRPGGELEKCWVCFDFVKRIQDWTTMACHVYNPYVQEMQTIAIGEFKVEDTNAQVIFWELLNKVMVEKGYEKAEFKGFMADEAQANWRAIRIVFNGGADIIYPERERSCLFHWEQSLEIHSKRCILPSSQEEFKFRCRKWKNAGSKHGATIELNSLNSWLKLGHAKVADCHMLQTWLSWWHVRVSHWNAYMLKNMEDNDALMVPRTNLAETVHGSWLAGNSGVKYITLLDACTTDLTNSLLQIARHTNYLKGRHLGHGPNIERLKRRYSTGSSNVVPPKAIDLTNEVVEEMDLASNRGTEGDMHTIRRRRRNSDVSFVQDNDSHRPEYEYVSVPRQNLPRGSVSSAQKNTGYRVSFTEEEVHRTAWAIRRTKPQSKVKCQGYLEVKGQICHNFINHVGNRKKTGVCAPCFWGKVTTEEFSRQQWVWFCPDNVEHTWSPSTAIERPIPPRPIEWMISKGTKLSVDEYRGLKLAGFLLKESDNYAPPPSDVRPSSREGKPVLWQENITAKMKKRIASATILQAVISSFVVFQPHQHVEYTISTPGSQLQGVQYKVVIAKFPSCTCPDFVYQFRKDWRYTPCKHLYWIFMVDLGLNADIHMFIHQAGLTDRELFQALQNK